MEKLDTSLRSSFAVPQAKQHYFMNSVTMKTSLQDLKQT